MRENVISRKNKIQDETADLLKAQFECDEITAVAYRKVLVGARR